MATRERRLTVDLSPPRALLLANPKSRSGGDPDTVAGLLREAGLDPLCPAMDDRDTAALIRAHAGKVDRVVLAGGDGTMNAAAPALLETGLPFAIIPLGTGNDLARTLGVPEDPAEAARVAAEGRLRAIDVALANDVPFFNVASIGFGVELTRALTRDAKRRWGKLGYAVAAARVLARMRPFSATIRCGDEVVRSRTIHVAVGNGRHYGGGLTVSPGASIDDHVLDVYAVTQGRLREHVSIARLLRTGHLVEHERVHHLTARRIRLVTDEPLDVNLDGEVAATTPATFEVDRNALHVVVPAQSRAARMDGTTSP